MEVPEVRGRRRRSDAVPRGAGARGLAVGKQGTGRVVEAGGSQLVMEGGEAARREQVASGVEVDGVGGARPEVR